MKRSVDNNIMGWWFFKKETSKTPFGMTMPGRSYNAHTLRHGFTGHEKESDLAEGIYTTEYRLYDARVGRWLSVDPLFEKYVGMSPYNYCMLNPVMMVDLDGREVNAKLVITKIESKTFGYTAHGILTITDNNDKRKKIEAKTFSGGIPYGNPIPEGKYDILQPTKKGHFRLEAQDSHYGDDKVEGQQKYLRLHGKGSGNTQGCISVENDSDWNSIVKIMNGTNKTKKNVESKSRNPFASKTEELKKYGTLEVIVKKDIENYDKIGKVNK